jgi:hypothetical protein
MDWQLAIEKNRDALLRIVAALYVFAGLTEGAVAAVLPRHVCKMVLRVLRPAESALRRLIMIAARGIVIKLGDSINSSPISTRNEARWWHNLSKLPPKFSLFLLIDPLKRFGPFTMDTVNDGAWFGFEFVENDDAEQRGTGIEAPSIPRISVPGFYEPAYVVAPVSSPDDLINAAQLTARLSALHRALNTLPKQAQRLARWLARRDFSRKQFPMRTGRMSPVRPGPPPGIRRRSAHEVHAILRECHLLMLDARDTPDTS